MKVLGFALLAAAVAAAHADERKPVEMRMSWVASIDADGHVASLTPIEKHADDVEPKLASAIRSWTFTPGKVAGKPAATETTLMLDLVLEPDGTVYRARLKSAATGPRYGKLVAPAYPDDDGRSRRGGAVLLDVAFDADGRVTDATPVVDGASPKAGVNFNHAAIAAVKHWTLVPERIDGHGLAGTALIPICFSKGAHPTACVFHDPATNAPIDGDRPLTASVAKLDSDVVGHAL